jgi:hypothetical protein
LSDLLDEQPVNCVGAGVKAVDEVFVCIFIRWFCRWCRCGRSKN